MSAPAVPPSGDYTKEKKSKWRLSNVFNKDDAKNTSHNQGQNVHSAHGAHGGNTPGQGSHDQPGLAPEYTRDSAYGGSETTTTDPSPNPSTIAVPTISAGQAEAQGAAVETRTDSRGRTITTTTTTVVTTTTTTEGDSLLVPAGEEVIVRRDENTTTRSKSADYREPTTLGTGNEPSIPARNAMRNKSPHGGHLAPQHDAPPVDVPASPSSPSHQNFSYPGRQAFGQNGRRSSLDQQRTPQNSGRPRPPVEPPHSQVPMNHNLDNPQYQRQAVPPPLQMGQGSGHTASNTPAYIDPVHNAAGQSGFAYRTPSQNSSVQSTIEQTPVAHNAPLQPATQGYPQRTSTAQSIRTAAAGIHGAGEALRGALNSSVARSTGGTPEEIARYEAIAQRGRLEVETGQFVKVPPPIPEVPTSLADTVPEKKRGGLIKNVLRKKSPARNA